MKLTQYFICSDKAKNGIITLVVLLACYVAACWAVSLAAGILGIFPLVGSIIKLVGWLIRVYLGCCALVAILAFLKVVK